MDIFILLSIKTRIETYMVDYYDNYLIEFLSYYPLKQGLKPQYLILMTKGSDIFILLSIKTRIET